MAWNERKHFAAEELVDFVNKQLSPAQTEAIQHHLDAGCDKCAKRSETWSLISQACKRESKFEAPESAVRHLRSAFATLAKPKEGRRKFEIPRLVFDRLKQAFAQRSARPGI